jgi:hypothetical protein
MFGVVGDTPHSIKHESQIQNLNNMNIQEITGRQVLSISALPGTFDYAVEKGTPMHGKKYRRFAFDGKVFVVNTEDAFCAEFDSGKLYSAKLSINDEGQLSIVGKTNIDQETNMAKAEATLNRIVTASKIPNLTEEQLLALENEI